MLKKIPDTKEEEREIEDESKPIDRLEVFFRGSIFFQPRNLLFSCLVAKYESYLGKTISWMGRDSNFLDSRREVKNNFEPWRFAINTRELTRGENLEPAPLRAVIELVLRKPINLPEVEITRGLEHVNKVPKDVKCKYPRGKVIYIHAQIIMPLQNYNLTSKTFGTKCNHKRVEKQNACFSS